jgi:hypothetical protein
VAEEAAYMLPSSGSGVEQLQLYYCTNLTPSDTYIPSDWYSVTKYPGLTTISSDGLCMFDTVQSPVTNANAAMPYLLGNCGKSDKFGQREASRSRTQFLHIIIENHMLSVASMLSGGPVNPYSFDLV